MNLQITKVFRILAKGVLVLTGLFLLGFLGWTVYKGIKFRPYKVRVTNVTDSAFTVSWVTDSPMPGIVYYGEKNTFLPGPLAWLGKKKAVDDRDFSDAQSECVRKFNKEASKNKDENFTVDASGFNCNDIKVWKYGEYYTHHITVQNLDAEKEYFFRVGDGVLSYSKGKTDGVVYVEREIPEIDSFKQKTLPVITKVEAPNPAYGTSYNVYYREDGTMGEKKNFDSLIFLKTFKGEEDLPYLSSVTNSSGGWTIDLANVRTADGTLVSMDGASLEFMPQVENSKPGAAGLSLFHETVFPLNLLGNRQEDWKTKVEGAMDSNFYKTLIKNSYAVVGSYVPPSCKYSTTGGVGGFSTKKACCQEYFGNDDCATSKTVMCYRCNGAQIEKKEFTNINGTCGSGYSTTTPTCNYFKDITWGEPCVGVGGGKCKCPDGSTVGEGNSCVFKPVEKGYEEKCDKIKCICPDKKVIVSGQSCSAKPMDRCNDLNNMIIEKPVRGGCENGNNYCYLPYYHKLSNNTKGELCTYVKITGVRCESTCPESPKPILKKGEKCKNGNGCDCGGTTIYLNAVCEGFGNCYFYNSSIKSCYKATLEKTKCISQGGFLDKKECVDSKICINKGVGVLNNFTYPCGHKEGCSCPSGAENTTVQCGQKCLYKGGCINNYSNGQKRELSTFKDQCQDKDGCKCPPNSQKSEVKCMENCVEMAKDLCKGDKDGIKYTIRLYTEKCQDPDKCICPDTATDRTADCGYPCKLKEGILDLENFETPCNNTQGCNCPKDSLFSFIQSGKCTQRSKTVLKDFKTPCPDEIGCKCPKGAEKEEVEEDYSCYEKINEFCWEMKSGFNEATRVLTGECVETKARNTAKQCEKLGYYVSPEECRKKLPKDGGQTYCFELNKTSGCKGISKFDICFEENGSIKQGFYATSGQCSDELEKRSLEKGQKCTDENCYCTESSYGNIIKNGECCGPSWGYDVYDKNIHECTPTNGYARDKIYCSISDCQTDRVRVILKKVCDSIGANKEDCDSNEYVNVANNGTVCVSHNGSCKWVEDEKFLRYRNDYFLSCKIDDCGTPSRVGIPGQNSKLVSSVQAEENEVKGMDILYFPEEGVYKVETVNGGTLSVLGGKENKYLLYYDRNGQEGYQSPEDPQNPKEDDDLLVSQAAVVVKTEKILNTNQVNVRKGINIISFDFLPMLGDKRGMNFSDFLKIANSKGDTISRISGFSGGSWQGGAIYDFNTKEVNGLSSELLTFGKGYVLLAIKDGTISIPGYKIESAVPIAFSSGWNLVGVHGYSTAYTAKTFIESINTIEGLKANNVTWWPTSRGMYQGYQLQNGQEYGQDFPISPINGYFVRIAEFTPKEDTCKSLIWNPSGEMNGECGSNN